MGPNMLLASGASSLFESTSKNVVHLNKKRGTHRPAIQFIPSSTATPNGTQRDDSSEADEDVHSQSAVSIEVNIF